MAWTVRGCLYVPWSLHLTVHYLMSPHTSPVTPADVVGSGSSGVAATFLTLGCGYFAMMLTGAMMQRVPQEGWLPSGWDPSSAETTSLVTDKNVDATTVLKTPQFYLLWTAVFGNAIAGVSVISCAKTMMNDTFSAALPAVVTGGFAASYVAALSAGNMLGRLGWASASDYLGRKRTYVCIPVAGLWLRVQWESRRFHCMQILCVRAGHSDDADDPDHRFVCV